MNKTPWIVLLLLWMGGSTWWHVCKIKQLCAESPPSAAAAQPPLMPPLTIADGAKLNWNVAGNFSFAKSGVVPNETAVGNTLQTVADYLKANPGRMLTVTGYYHPGEKNTGEYANLGLARAEYLKVQLVALGVPATRLDTKGEPVSVLRQMPYNPSGDSLYGGLVFRFAPAPVIVPEMVPDSATVETELTTDDNADKAEKSEEKETATAESKLADAEKFTSVFEPINLYFESGQPDYIETEATKKFFDEAETYLKEHKGKKLVLRGYTDNEGDELANVQLSRERANAVKERLVKGGVKPDQIKVMAKGETEPKESNATEAGRRANRRVSAVVQ